MWNISIETKRDFATCNLLPIHESDDEWEIALREAEEEGEDLISRLKEELEEVKEDLLPILPSRFVPYLENGTLNQPTLSKTVREDYLQWVNEGTKKFEQISDAAYERKIQALPFLSPAVQEVFEDSLHDSVIQRIERCNDTLHLYVNTDGGFSSKAIIHFIFKGILSEETDEPLQVGQWFIYDELQKMDGGFAYRVLFECPESQWTITMKDLDATYFYRPKEFTRLRDQGKIDGMSIADYIGMLNPDHDYWLITPNLEIPIQSFADESIIIENGSIQFEQNEMVVTLENERFSYELSEHNPIEFIYTNVEEDPYAYLHETLPFEDMESALLSEDPELQAKAWNTMYANPIELVDIINDVLLNIEITDENEMMLSVFVDHFYKNGILKEEVKAKYASFIMED